MYLVDPRISSDPHEHCTPLGVDPPPAGHGPDFTGDRPTGSGLVCFGAQHTPPAVLLQGSGPGTVEDRRLLLPVGVERTGMRLIPNPPYIAKNQTASGPG